MPLDRRFPENHGVSYHFFPVFQFKWNLEGGGESSFKMAENG